MACVLLVVRQTKLNAISNHTWVELALSLLICFVLYCKAFLAVASLRNVVMTSGKAVIKVGYAFADKQVA